MANKAKQTTDESALNAVEKALSIDFSDGKSESQSEAELKELEKSLAETADQLRDDSEANDLEESQPEDLANQTPETEIEDDFPTSPPVPANDEHSEELNNLIYAIQQKPSSRVFFWTLLASLLWLGLTAYYTYSSVWPSLDRPVSLQSLISNSEFITLTAIAIIPLLPLWGFAVMLRRAHEMRHAAGSMIQASLRLLQPEKIAADSVATVGTAIRREMTAIGDGVERAIARAGELEFMVQKEVMSLERSYGDSEVRLRRLLDDIGVEREQVISHAEKLRNSITESQSGLTTEIDIASNRIDEKIKHAADMLSETLTNEGITITSRLKETSDGLIEILARTGGEIYTNLDTGAENLKTGVSDRIKEMSEVLSTSGQAVATLIDGRTARFEATANTITDKLDTGKKAFEIAFSERSEELTKIMSTAGHSVATLLKSSSADLAERSNKMVMDLEDNRKQMEEALDHQSRQFTQLSNLATDNLSSAFELGSSRFEESAVKIAQNLEDNLSVKAEDFNEKVSETAAIVESSVTGNLDKVEQSFTQHAQSFDTSIAENLGRLDTTLSSSGNDLVSALGMRTEALDKVLQERTETIGQTIAERLSGFGKNLTGHVDDAVVRLKEQTDSLQENTKSVEDVILKRTQSVEETIKSSTIEFAEGLKESLQTTSEKSSELNQALEETTSNLLNTLDSAGQKLTSSVDSGAEKLRDSIQSGSQTISDTLAATDETIGARFAEGAQQLSASLDSKKDELSEALTKDTDDLREVLAEKTNNLAAKLNQGIHRVASALDTTGTKAAEELEKNVNALEQRLLENSHSLEKQFAAGSVILQENLDKGRDTLVDSINKTVEEAGFAIDGKAEKLSNLLSERATLINNTLGKSLVDTQRELENKTSDINNLLSSRTQEINALLSERSDEINTILSSRSVELSQIIERDAKPIIQSIESTGEAINNRLASMNKIVAEEANTLFENLTVSNTQLENLINSATENLSLMQASLGQQSSGFAEAVAASKTELEESNRIAQDVEGRLQSASTNLMQNMASIATRLEAQGATLQDATRLIDTAQTNLSDTLETKQQSLQDLASGLVLRSDEINTSVSSFAQMISSMIEDIHARSKGTGSEIAAEVSAAIDDATARFGDSVDAMRSAAVTIRQELEDTREQMRRGILELPDETAQNAAAMRRVVTDQIAALKDLSSIVERSGMVLDTSVSKAATNSVPAPVQAVAGGDRNPAAYQAPPQAPPQPRQPAQAAFPPDTQPRRPAPAFDPNIRTPQQQEFTQQRERAQYAPEPAQAPSTRENTGWVSDLLRRASSDEPRAPAPSKPLPDTRSPDQFVESLNSLSMDIASAIDHEASVDLWERYQRGETNVFTRRLYTLQGQQTFDEIREKYVREREFRSAVDRYIDDFERLLGDVSRSDRGGAMAQKYLTSDTGKVYTMLAHAAGRFEN
ncbi:MAG: hypothetical protein AAGA53_00300 [Pseudomonadota bacterium]